MMKQIPLRDVCIKATLVDPRKVPDATFRYVDVSSVSNAIYAIGEIKVLAGKEAPSRARKQIQVDDVLFATVRPTLKRVAIVPPELDGAICSTGFCVVRPDRNLLEPRYAYYSLLSERITEEVDALQKGVAYRQFLMVMYSI